MDTIVLYNQNGQKFDVDIIRYFKINGNKYLIFSMDEIDGNGYLQLYVSRIEEFNGKYNMLNITDDAEWDAFKKAIHGIVNNNRAGIPNNDDLDFNPLDGTVINQFRIFKLKKDVAEQLSQNKAPQVPAVAEAPVVEEVTPAVEKVENASNLEQEATVQEEKLENVENDINYARIESDIDRLTMETLLRKLDEDEREIIMLYVVFGYKHLEIAKQMGKPLSTVISRYNRAIKKMRTQL